MASTPATITLNSPDRNATRSMQQQLTRKGFELRTDGLFGAETSLQLRRFQSRVGLASDGVCGPRTWAALASGFTAPPLVPQHTNAMSSYVFANDAAAWARAGHRYVFGAKAVPIGEPSPAALDCSGLVEWAVCQATGEHWVAGARYQAAASHITGVDYAIRTKGALLFQTHNGFASGVHHVAVSLGNGWTAEARSANANPECGSFPAAGRFNMAGQIPVLRY